MLTTIVFALVAGGALIVGALLGSFWKPPEGLRAAMLAFGAGALVVALAFELFEPAHRQSGLFRASAALVAGAAVFIVVDYFLERRTGAEAVGLALVAAVTLDGVPENLALGVSLAEKGSLALLAAIIASNLPESFGGAAVLRSAGKSVPYALGIWALTALLLALAVLAGRLGTHLMPQAGLGLLAAFAAGAVLASIADTVMPEAYAEGGPLVAFATIVGFLVAYGLTTVD